MIPERGPDQSFEAHQADMAFWLGCDVHTMNAMHDGLHRAMCAWLGVTSQAMRDAAGEALSAQERNLAALEEVACLTLQRFAVAAGAGVPARPEPQEWR